MAFKNVTEEEYEALVQLVERERANVRLPEDALSLIRSFADDSFALVDPKQDELWQYYVSEIRSTLSPGGSFPNLQIATVLNPVRWSDPDYGGYYFHVDAADTLPVPGGSYGKTANSFQQRYYDFMSAITPTPIDADALKKAQDVEDERRQDFFRLEEVEQVYAKAWAEYDARQAQLPPFRRKTAEQWYKDVEADKSIAAQRAIVDAKEGQFLYWMQKALSPDEALLSALARYYEFKTPVGDPADPAKKVSRLIKVKVPRNSENPDSQVKEPREVFPYTVSPDLPNWLKEAPQRSSNLNMKYTRQSSRYEYSKTRIAGGALLDFGFFGVVGGGSRTTISIDSSSETFGFEFSAVAEAFTIAPGEWYDGSIFNLYRSGPFKEGSPFQTAAREGRLFGPNGFISFRPARAYIAYKPKAKITFSRQDYDYYKQNTNGWAAFGIGPFVVGVAGYENTQVRSNSDDQSGTLELFGESNLPYLLAFDYEDMDPNI